MIFNPSEVFVRHDAEFADVDVQRRLIDMVAVPWDEEAEVPWRGEIWREVFRRGAYDGIEQSVGRVRVNREHIKGNTVGKLVFADPEAEPGLIVRAKIAKTDTGDETLALAAEDMISPSVGYVIKEPKDINLNHRTRMREVLRAFLDHLGLVESPAFSGAQVLAVREEQREPVLDAPAHRQALDDAWNDPAYRQALQRLTKHD